MEYKEFYRRHLPHWQPRGAMMFITYRLAGSIPQEKLKALRSEYEKELKAIKGDTHDKIIQAGKRFIVEIDKVLDSAQTGPTWLNNPEVAKVILENLHHHVDKLFQLWSYIIMPNHVHTLLHPLRVGQAASPVPSEQSAVMPTDIEYVPINRITHALKSYTATVANKILKRTGTFWQDESYDHWVRDEEEFWRIVEYIEMNAVKAKLCKEPTDWPWSSAFERHQLGMDYLAPLHGLKK